MLLVVGQVSQSNVTFPDAVGKVKRYLRIFVLLFLFVCLFHLIEEIILGRETQEPVEDILKGNSQPDYIHWLYAEL